MATLIGRKFHVSYSVSGATRLMHRLGFSPQVPARRGAERDEQAVTAWKERIWAEAKGPGRPLSSYGRCNTPVQGVLQQPLELKACGATSASRTKQGSPGSRPGDEPGAGEGAPRS
ncbi:winged helix-turn-helix domain-containing protein [Streptomyces sp. M92]|uniref:helix-turn-helix domain-containing protein n=1 Tax=Streptomyces sp. NPDC057367 TaxID=3346108 RepID=UPI00234B0743|nr:winged helix-turn-helix domain-containing protein [Streptomyces sp. M92]WCN04063.1 winged helix-turn-helix domain-containing protein [Streptomyces sp. M92]